MEGRLVLATMGEPAFFAHCPETRVLEALGADRMEALGRGKEEIHNQR